MGETTIVINRAEVSWTCWEYLCIKCKADAFKTKSLLLYVSKSSTDVYQQPKEAANG
jgi:hypothetical protein